MKDKHIVVAAVLIVAFAGLFLRTDQLEWETYGYGEVEIKEAAESYAAGNFVNNFYLFDTPPFGKYLFAVSILALGSNEIALRLVSVLFGVLSILMTFIFSRKLYGDRTAVLAAAITSFSIIHIQLSRYAQLETILAFFYIAIAYFLWESLNENKKLPVVFLGISLGLALATKFTSLIILAAIAVYAVYSRRITDSRKFSMRNSPILKAVLIAVIVFLAAWPFGFSRLHTEADVSVDYGGIVRSQNIEADVPIMLLSFSRRIFTSFGDSTDGILGVPVFNYVMLFIAKESLLLIPLLFAGLYFMFRKPLKGDALVLIFLLTFLILLTFQRTSISYRHIVPMVPFVAIIASRWILHAKRQWIFIAAVGAIMFAYAFLAGPSYTLSYNSIKEAAGLPDSEFRFNEGMKETIGYLKENCDSTYANDYYRIMTEPYYDNIFSEPPAGAECVIKGNVDDGFDADSYINENSCTLAKSVRKNSVRILDIYEC